MSLSQANIDKLNMNGLYHCEPVLEWLPWWKRDNPYWCRNWTFRVRKYDDNYYMYDTYWSTGDDYPVKLTDENFDKFELVFDFNDVEEFKCGYLKFETYTDEDRFCVAVDSGGVTYPKHFIRKDAMPQKDLVISRIQDEITDLQRRLDYKKKELEDVINDKVDLRWV